MRLKPHIPRPSVARPALNPPVPWTCWVCGDTHTPTGEPLTNTGQRIRSHLRAHLLEGLVRPATPAERIASKAFFALTPAGETFIARRRLDPSTPRPPALPQPGTQSREVYDVIAEFPGVRLLAIEIADECGLPLQLASAFAHHLARRGVVRIETGGRGRQAEFWVEA
ncbi:hypothetical protein DGo_PE0041 (plasmid) [Deinococcus gobiensis I-0]|uniref:Uncharacterized protein n=1 Tax=Deinococcus gobiensis (strain DSM 21396 / JCM 16679 / CGMCC 1.7299 / I-0) TaxID=745776 RepID=H8H3T8_DEIGI|nr:hypothetical protein DGo_PE0041 [Deinococcus gobiensis I-0]